MKSLRVINAILCEFAAQGSGGRHTLVNVFSGKVVTESLPALFHFGLFIQVDPGDGDERAFEIEIRLGRRVAGKLVATADERDPRTLVNLVVQAIELMVERPDVLTVSVKSEGIRRTVALRKEISVRSSA